MRKVRLDANTRIQTELCRPSISKIAGSSKTLSEWTFVFCISEWKNGGIMDLLYNI